MISVENKQLNLLHPDFPSCASWLRGFVVKKYFLLSVYE